ncbi:hypothetical protein DPMN_160388 [Dreissena polymorpha]|uniref:Uncharacterized protein n=1 Tax=Dreissena polymorpha TaxID=45954 RepID=A0A9D4EN32_DREPO|nr:hypothetical protein DPMN_160388 [Dreissena polymorpha]
MSIAAIILTCGDVEFNPGPPKETGPKRQTQHPNQDAALESLDVSVPNRPMTRSQAPSGAITAIDAQSQNAHRTAFDPQQRRISTYATPLVSHPNSQELSQESNPTTRDENRSVKNTEISELLSTIRNDINKQPTKYRLILQI